jgi:hypothetical protein
VKKRPRIQILGLVIVEPKENSAKETHRMKKYFDFNDEFNGFINLLIDYYNKYIINCKNDNLVPNPNQVNELTKLYLDDHDSLLSVNNENFVITNDAKDKLVRKDFKASKSAGQFKDGKTDFSIIFEQD